MGKLIQDKKARIIWKYRRGDEDGLVMSINEANFGTWAHARIWIEKQIPARSAHHPSDPELELDIVYLDEIGDFVDEGGKPCKSQRIATYEHGLLEWTWAEHQLFY